MDDQPRDRPLDRLRALCLALPGVSEERKWMPSWSVAGRKFAWYVDHHHGDTRVAAWLKVPPGSQEQIAAEDPNRRFVPPYMGPQGWVAFRVDMPADWDALAQWVEDAYRLRATKKLLAQAGDLASARPHFAGEPEPPEPVAERPPRLDLLERLRAVCLGLPEVEEGTSFGSPVFRVRGKSFAEWVYNSSGSGRSGANFKSTPSDQALLVDARPDWFSVPPYIGPRGWVGVALDSEDLDWDVVEEMARAAYRLAAPARLAAAL